MSSDFIWQMSQSSTELDTKKKVECFGEKTQITFERF